MADSPVAAHDVKQSRGEFELSSKSYEQCAVRHRGQKGQRIGESRPRRAQEVIAHGMYRAKVGDPARSTHEPADQRGPDELATTPRGGAARSSRWGDGVV